MPGSSTIRRGPGRTVLAWAAANLALGYGAIFPLVSAMLLGYYGMGGW